MRCTHCASEILDDSRFCGICGRAIAAARRQDAPGQGVATPPAAGAARRGAGSASALELPVSRGARRGRILAVLALDMVMAGVGLALILSHARGCDRARDIPAAVFTGDAPEARK